MTNKPEGIIMYHKPEGGYRAVMNCVAWHGFSYIRPSVCSKWNGFISKTLFHW